MYCFKISSYNTPTRLPALMEIKPDSPHYITANRLIKFLKYFKEMDSTWVPCNSLLREFIGGSCFNDV